MKLLAIALAATMISSAAFAKCPTNKMIVDIQSKSDAVVESSYGNHLLYMGSAVKGDKIFVVAENQDTCRVQSGFMTSEKIWDVYGISYEEVFEAQDGEGF